MQDINIEIKNLQESLKKLIGETSESEYSFLSQIEHGLVSVIATLSEIFEIDQEFSETMEILFRTVNKMSDFINDIEVIGSEIDLIAINAQVKAAHTGDEGAALGVLAGSIQKLSVDAFSLTGGISDSFKSIISNAQSLGLKESFSEDVAYKINSMKTSCENMINSLQEINDSVHSQLKQMNSQVQDLSSDIDLTISTSSIKENVSNYVKQIATDLENLVNDMKVFTSRYGYSSEDVDMNAISAKYTMVSEREVHQSFTEGKIINPDRSDEFTELKPENEPGDDASEFGANVELF